MTDDEMVVVAVLGAPYLLAVAALLTELVANLWFARWYYELRPHLVREVREPVEHPDFFGLRSRELEEEGVVYVRHAHVHLYRKAASGRIQFRPDGSAEVRVRAVPVSGPLMLSVMLPVLYVSREGLMEQPAMIGLVVFQVLFAVVVLAVTYVHSTRALADELVERLQRPA